ncbi:MAG: phage tail protein [Lachnospiraceae bacterium]|nr:phage tail protein [Lachnospiraceae bacterium]MCM1240965.1 phage tail protein [Lachnospiraceae bacterium]
MSDKSQNVVITKAARRKMVQARAGAIVLPRIVGMAFGNGGVDADGNILSPKEGQDTLAGELYRKPIDGYSFPDETSCRYECTLLEKELAGTEISEVGLYDEDGDILCIKAFRRKGKDDDVEQTYVLDDIF